jgi:hypothetical protein
MNTLISILIVFACLGTARADFQRLEDDALSSPEKAEETAQIINNNFGNFWATKVDISTPAASGPDQYVSDLLDPEQADMNTFIILNNADRLWQEKVDFDGIFSPGGRTVNLETILNPDKNQDIIQVINEIFQELDNAKVESEN